MLAPRRKRYGTYSRREHLPKRISIEHRSIVVDRRRRFGDGEVDTIIGKGHQQARNVTATFGEIVALLSVSPVYKHMSLAELKWFR